MCHVVNGRRGGCIGDTSEQESHELGFTEAKISIQRNMRKVNGKKGARLGMGSSLVELGSGSKKVRWIKIERIISIADRGDLW